MFHVSLLLFFFFAAPAQLFIRHFPACAGWRCSWRVMDSEFMKKYGDFDYDSIDVVLAGIYVSGFKNLFLYRHY